MTDLDVIGSPAPILIEVAPGDLIDRLTILEIKKDKIRDPAKLGNVQRELATLRAAHHQGIPESVELHSLTADLRRVNETLWDVEDEIRQCERNRDFRSRFIELARSVYRHNDQRAALKRRINQLLGSQLIEEKLYERYE